MSTIAENKVVTFHYTLTNDAGEVIDSSEGHEPLPYLHGHHGIVPGLEAAMAGHAVGDKFTADVPPEQGYGMRQGPGPQAVPRSEFPPDAELMPGMQFGAQTEDGQVVRLFVTAVDEANVWVDQEHPLAGQTLHFAIEIVDIRDAKPEEIEHGHTH